MSFVRKFIACLISIALVLAQLSAAARGTSIDVAGNGSVLSLGINGSKGSASRKWTSPSGIVTRGSLDVIVENATRLKGAVIASQSNDLQLSTRTLSTQDIALYDNDRQVSGSIGINTTINGPNGPNGPKSSIPGFNIDATYANKQIKGIARATISGGQIEVTSQTGKQTARQLASLNRNADKSLEITSVIDEGFELYISDTSIKAVGKIARVFFREINELVTAGNISPEQADILRKITACGGQQGFNSWNPLNWIITPAYAEEDCSDITLKELTQQIDVETLKQLIDVCKDPILKAEAQYLLTMVLKKDLSSNDIYALEHFNPWDIEGLKKLSPEALEVVKVLSDLLSCTSPYCILKRQSIESQWDSNLLQIITFAHMNVPKSTPIGIFKTDGLTFSEYLTAVQTEELISIGVGLGIGKAFASAIVKLKIVPTLAAKLRSLLKGGADKTVDDIVGSIGKDHPLAGDLLPRKGTRTVYSQGATLTCGHNSCGMVLDTLGKSIDPAVLIQNIKPGSAGIGMNQVASLFRSQGVNASTFAGENVDDLARYTQNGTPVIARIKYPTPGASNGGHAVVIDGVTTRSGIPVVAIRDPHGAQYFSPVSTFKQHFSGHVVVPKP